MNKQSTISKEYKKVRCVDCHFLIGVEFHKEKFTRISAVPDERRRILTKQDRQRLRNMQVTTIDGNLVNVFCGQGFWMENYDIGKFTKEVLRNRPINKCTFWEYTENLTLQGAEILQKRNEDREAFKTTMFFSRLAILLAAIALLFNLISLLKK